MEKEFATSSKYFIEYPITEVMYRAAKKRADKLGKLNHSIMKGKGNIWGCLAEEIFKKMYPEALWVDTNDFDFILHGVKIDVKGKRLTHRREPAPFYEASVALVTKLQKTHVYFFYRISDDYKRGWAMGWFFSWDYKAGAIRKQEGDFDPMNGMTFLCDCLNRPYSDLYTVNFFDYAINTRKENINGNRS
jgi:hypothetical protein